MKKKKKAALNEELPPNSAVLEHTDTLIYNVHDPLECGKEFCTVHNRSNHHLRSFPQYWREDLGIMERTCPHGVGHPDPDEFMISKEIYLGIHGCDGCCTPIRKLIVRKDLRKQGSAN
jgi:hypothetical protein